MVRLHPLDGVELGIDGDGEDHHLGADAILEDGAGVLEVLDDGGADAGATGEQHMHQHQSVAQQIVEEAQGVAVVIDQHVVGEVVGGLCEAPEDRRSLFDAGGDLGDSLGAGESVGASPLAALIVADQHRGGVLCDVSGGRIE